MAWVPGCCDFVNAQSVHEAGEKCPWMSHGIITTDRGGRSTTALAQSSGTQRLKRS